MDLSSVSIMALVSTGGDRERHHLVLIYYTPRAEWAVPTCAPLRRMLNPQVCLRQVCAARNVPYARLSGVTPRRAAAFALCQKVSENKLSPKRRCRSGLLASIFHHCAHICSFSKTVNGYSVLSVPVDSVNTKNAASSYIKSENQTIWSRNAVSKPKRDYEDPLETSEPVIVEVIINENRLSIYPNAITK